MRAKAQWRLVDADPNVTAWHIIDLRVRYLQGREAADEQIAVLQRAGRPFALWVHRNGMFALTTPAEIQRDTLVQLSRQMATVRQHHKLLEVIRQDPHGDDFLEMIFREGG